MNSKLTHDSLLRVWEQCQSTLPPQRALSLLETAGEDPVEIRSWPVGMRDRRLLELRCHLFGEQVSAVVGCSSCDSLVALELRASDLITAPAGDIEAQTLESSGCQVRWRLPTCDDLMELSGYLAPDAVRDGLLERCILEAHRGGDPLAAAELPIEVISAICAAMSEADPLADLRLAIQCPECGTNSEMLFDVTSFLWCELGAWADSLLRDVHHLAQAYGWTEREVLELAPTRRRRYLELIGA